MDEQTGVQQQQAWAEDGICFNGIAPGLLDTKMTKVTTAKSEMARRGDRADFAKAAGDAGRHGGSALFLALPLSSYIVGRRWWWMAD